MSMFRRPGDSSSSEDESSDGREETSGSVEDHLLSRINTLDSAQSTSTPGERENLQVASNSSSLPRSNTNEQFRDLVLHSLLEDKATTEASSHLGKDRLDPEVQQLARTIYQRLAQQLSGNMDDHFASDEMRGTRATATAGINRITRNHLTGITAAANATATTAAAGASQALVPRPPGGVSFIGSQAAPGGAESLLEVQPPLPLFLQGHAGLNTDRYAREYEELEVVGKGGYGKVYKVKHKLDNSYYAVKKIVIGSTKLQKIQERKEEMESLLEEVRSLARFDHVNIVRYHSAWLEFSTGSADVSCLTTGDLIYPERMLPEASVPTFSTSNSDMLHTSFRGLAVHADFDNTSQIPGADIVFEASETGAGAEKSLGDDGILSLPEKRKDRRGSQATVGTISSTRSRMSAVEDIGEEDEDDIETIPRSLPPVFDESSSMVSNSDMPNQLVTTRATGPVLTLNVQMSLYDTNLAAFLSTELPPPHHCFHPCISLELLSSILSGVEYLHARGVVHRDLKPANIFLSLSTDRIAPAGSIDLSSCSSCPDRTCLQITPRIGDFGLVAALGDNLTTDSTAAKPVGTEFYRPSTNSRISEKLDVFALGVVAFEMLQRFETRSERADALMKLKRGQIQGLDGLGEGVVGLIRGMVVGDEEERWGCETVQREIGRAVAGLKV